MKYLILSVPTGGGHDAAANAVAEALKSNGHDAEVYDSLGIVSTFLTKAVCGGYLWLVKHVPKFFGVMYNASYNFTKPERKSFIYKMTAYRVGRLARFINEFNPDAVITTHVFAAQQLANLKRKGKLNRFLAGVITDYDIQPLWEETDMDIIFTPHESLNEGYRRRGVDKAQLIAAGIPVSPEVVCPADRNAAKAAAGLETDMKHIVVAGGSMGAGKMPATVKALLDIADESTQIVVVCGSNRRLKRRFERMNEDRCRLRILGFVRPLHKLIAAADVFISKPGGLSSSEAFNVRCPMIVVHPIGGVESHNAEFMKKHGLALCPADDREIAECAKLVLNDGKTADDLKKAMEKFVSSSASEQIAKRIIEETQKA